MHVLKASNSGKARSRLLKKEVCELFGYTFTSEFGQRWRMSVALCVASSSRKPMFALA